MRSYISFGELEELGETIVREYLRKTKRYNALCVDIEGLVTDYLGLTVVYENIAEDDPNKIAFLSNGKRPLWVSRNEERIQVVFPKGTVVMDKVLLHENADLHSDMRARTALLQNKILCRMSGVFITNLIQSECIQ